MSETPPKSHVVRLLLAVSLPLYVLDQITKWWVVMTFRVPFVLHEGEK